MVSRSRNKNQQGTDGLATEIVAFGASAGGLQAMRPILRLLEPNGRTAYVVAQHMSTIHSSHLVELLGHQTKLTVVVAGDGAPLKADWVYVTPPGTDIRVQNDLLQLTSPSPSALIFPSIDELFVSVAAAFRERAVGVILSGSGFDGVAGAKAIQATGGLVMVQTPDEAVQGGMPEAALRAGVADMYGTCDELVAWLNARNEAAAEKVELSSSAAFTKLLQLVSETTHVDLEQYKEGTLRRRTRKRYLSLGLASDSEYLDYVRSHPDELPHLQQQFLISVTEFFRDFEEFRALSSALARLLEDKVEGDFVRVWVPACATGEEAYSIAILLCEILGERIESFKVRVFATDIDAAALQFARAGIYPDHELASLDASRRARFFVPEDKTWRVTPKVRAMCVFSTHDVTGHPPFINMDVVSCRNLLIYLKPTQQDELLEIFRYSLNTNGVLMLGKSESVGLNSSLFTAIDTMHKLYRRGASTVGLPKRFGRFGLPVSQLRPGIVVRPLNRRQGVVDLALKMIATQYGPASVLVNSNFEPLHFFGNSRQYFSLPDENADFSVFSLCLDELRNELKALCYRMIQEDLAALHGFWVSVKFPDRDVRVRPILRRMSVASDESGFSLLISLEEEPKKGMSGAIDHRHASMSDDGPENEEILRLRSELATTREHLQAVIEELETSNEELQFLNEELQSSTEELQASNEELQASNEELTTLNDELLLKTIEATELNTTLGNIQSSVRLGLVVVNREGKVVRFNSLSVRIFGLVQGDIGQSLFGVPSQLDLPHLRQTIEQVISLRESVVERVNQNGFHYLMMIDPYQDETEQCTGAVLTFTDISELHNAEVASKASEMRFRHVWESSLEGLLVLDADGMIVNANPALHRMFGYPDTELLGRVVETLVPESLMADHRRQRENFMRNPHGSRPMAALQNLRGRHQNGTLFPVEISVTAMQIDGTRYVLGTVSDVSERKAADAKITRLNNLYAALSHCNKAIVRCESEQALFQHICQYVVQFGGMKMAWIGLLDDDSRLVKPAVAYGNDVDYLEHITVSADPDSPFGHGAAGSAIRSDQPFWCQDYQSDPQCQSWLGRDPRFAWGGVAALPLHRSGRVIGAFVLYAEVSNAFDEAARELLSDMADDVSHGLDRFAIEAERAHLEADRKLAADVFDQSSEGITITDSERNIVLVNQAFCEITGYSKAEVLGRNPRILSSGRQDGEFYRTMWKSINETGRWQGELWNRRKDGVEYPEWLSISRVIDGDGNVAHYIGTFSDISQRKAAEEHIQWLAHFDALTGLPNRILAAERTHQSLAMVQRSGEPLALMFLDLDHFKNVNDSHGHHIGDALLSALATRLNQHLREQDTVSRLGGDEFILVLPGTDASGAAQLAEKLIDMVSQPFHIDQHELNMTTSIGVAMHPNDAENFESLSRCADVAVRHAKADGRNNYRFFTPEMQERSARRMRLQNDMHRALERNELLLHYQPQISMHDRRVVGAEALLRWNHPELGMVPPAEFIPIAESNGLILPIGEWVLRSAVRQWKRWRDDGLELMTIAVNLSAVQFKHPRLNELVMQILDEEMLAPQHLELELTEGVAMDDPLGAIAVMDGLYQNGIRLSIDDFGTGYSSLSYLKRFKVYKLKIDRSFVRDISEDPEDKAIVGAIISLAKNLGMQTIAEGVETTGQLDFLREKGCDEVQGFFFSKALEIDQFEAYVRGHIGDDGRGDLP